jgi:Ca2+-binding RTX toxin-like protein
MSEVVAGGIKLVFSNQFPNPKISSVVQAVSALEGTEAGRILLSFLPKTIAFNYAEGDEYSRSGSDPIFDNITLYSTAFKTPFDAFDVVWHELIHQIQTVRNLEAPLIGKSGASAGINAYLEGARNVLAEHKGAANFSYVSQPLQDIKNEETLDQDLKNLIWKLGYNRIVVNGYYIPGDESQGPGNVRTTPLTADERSQITGLAAKLASRGNSPEVNRKNWLAYEEFLRRARAEGWIGSDSEFQKRMQRERQLRGIGKAPQAAPGDNKSDFYVEIRDAEGDVIGGQLYKIDRDGNIIAGKSIQDVYSRDSNGVKIKDANRHTLPPVGEIRSGDGLNVFFGFKEGTRERISADIIIPGNPPVDFSRAGGILGQQLGYRLAGGNVLTGIAYSAALQTIGDNLGDVLDGLLFSTNGKANGFEEVTEIAFSHFGDEFLQNLKSAGIGALSSFLTAELINALGIHGFAGELANTSSGYVIGTIIANIVTGKNALDGLSGAQLGNVVGSFLGAKLASQIVHFDTVGGQIGSAVGSTVGAILADKFISIGGILGGPLGAAIGAFVGFILGGLIGSIFGGTPRSGADATWDSTQNKFVVANVWSKKGGSKDAARSLASAAAETFNAIISATGGTLLNPTAVTAGNYGMRKKDYVYQTRESRDQDFISFRASSKDKDGFSRTVGYGVVKGLTDPDFELVGGDVYFKRAVYNTFDIGSVDATNFDTNVLMGNISSAQSYENYLANTGVINALASAEPDSVFTTETLINLARADELGLTRRHRSDWFGGFSYLLRAAGANAANVDFGFDYDAASGRASRVIGIGNYTMGDTIDIAGQTTIEATAAAETIDLRTAKLADQRGLTVNGHLNNDIAATGSDFTAKTAAVAFAVGQLRQTVSVVIANDGVAEAAESFIGQLSAGTNLSVIAGSADATILDGTAATPTLMVGRSFAREGDGYAVFRVSLSKALASGSVSANLALADVSTTAGVDRGTAIEVSNDGVTWTAATAVTFTTGQTQKFVRVAVLADNTANPAYYAGSTVPQTLNVEGNERFTLTATVSAGANLLANIADSTGIVAASGTGTILDATTGTLPLAWIDAVTVDEASGSATFSIARSASGTAGSLTFSTADRRELAIDIAATVDGGDGNDTIYASDRGDNLFGGAGDDTLYGGRLDDWLLGGDGNDVLDVGTADVNALGGNGNYLNGGAGNDIVKGREGSDWLEGGDGIDTLTGGAGDDILAGGAGDGDNEKGGSGGDQYLVRRGDGLDIAEEDGTGAPVASGAGDAITQRLANIEKWKLNPATAGAVRPDWVGASAGVASGMIVGGDDAIVFGAGIDIGDIKLQRSGTSALPGNDLLVMIMQTVNGVETFSGTQLTVKDWFTNPFKRIEWLKFADGNEIRIGDITSFIIGDAGNDVLVGTSGNDFVYGGAGNDKLYLLAGDDVGNGGIGNDMVAGDTGRDLIIGGLGDDELVGGAGSDAITGDAGADDIYGGADRDIVSGGRGDGDVVVGGAGDDTFRYARGDGRDTYFDEYASYWDTVWTAAGGWNAAAGYSYNSLTSEVTGPGGVLIRKNFGTTAEPDLRWLGRYDYDSASQTLKLFNPPASAPTIIANAGVDTIELAPGINLQDVILRHPAGTNDLVLAIGSDEADLVDTSLAADSITIKDWYLAPGQIEKLAFYQTGILDITQTKTSLIAGTDGADGTSAAPLPGTAIADWITGGAGDDVIAGGAGNDIIAGNTGFDLLKGEAGDDVIYGGTGNDTLDGGAGKDILIGGSGQDAASYASSAYGLRASLSASWSNSGDAVGDEYTSIENLIGSGGGDSLLGDAGQNEITGGLGSDNLRGGAGDDTYVWRVGDGADNIKELPFTVEEAVTVVGQLSAGFSVKSWADTGTIDAATGNRYWRLQVQAADGTLVYDNATYSYAPGITPVVPTPPAYIQAGWLLGFVRVNGQQVAREIYDYNADGGNDVLEMGSSISLNDLTFIINGTGLTVRYGGSGASQISIAGHFSPKTMVETLQLADGLSVSLASISVATSSAQLVGTADDNLLVGQVGALADNLSGGDGNDVLVGYDGNDMLIGGNGDDVFEGGLGADTLDGGANSPSSAGADAGDTARYVRSASAVSIDLNLTAAQGGTAGSDSVGDLLTGIENVVGSAFDDTLTGDANDNRLFGLAGNDTLRGGSGMDILSGDDGHDLLYGDAGEDALSGGDGNDKLYGGTENDELDGGDGTDQLFGEAGNDMLSGQAGFDILDGGDGDDVLNGGADNDQLYGGFGNDTLTGGSGDDIIRGDAGNDVYTFDRNSGSDTLLDQLDSNVLTFTDVAYNEIWLTRVSNDLRIGVIGGGTQITVSGFFLSAGQSRIHAVQTSDHILFLDHPDTLNLVTAMTAATATPAVTPGALPTAVSTLLLTYWHAGDKAAPTGPATPRAITLSEDGTVNVDGTYGVIDHDRNLTGYSLKSDSGPTKGVISNFNSLTGALTYTPFADANGADSFVVIATDADGQSVALPVNVTITPVNDAPRNIAVTGTGTLSVLESAPGSSTGNGSVIGQFTALDVEGDAISYGLANNAGGRFAITATGQLYVANATLLDAEGAPSHTIQVTATDALGAAITTPFTVAVGNVNEAPNAPTLSSSRGLTSEYVAGVNSVNLGTIVAQFTTSDPDGTPAPGLAFPAGGNHYGYFNIGGTQVRFLIEPDFEALVAAGFAVGDSDGDGLGEVTLSGAVVANDGLLPSTSSTAFSVKIEDVNQQQTAVLLGSPVPSIDERDRLTAGSTRPAVALGTLSTTDPDLSTWSTGQQNYTVFEGTSTAASTRFGVNASNQLTLLANQSLDFETDGASITLKVRATDKSSSPLSLDKTFTFVINNIDDVVDGTAANDTLTGQQNRDILRGLAGNDTLTGLDGNDQLEGGDGNDALSGGNGDDTLLGQLGNDSLNGDAGNDSLDGGDGDDVLNGGIGADTLLGGLGNDGTRAAGTDAWRGFSATGLIGGDGNDILNGGDGDDYLDGGLGADQLIGGIGFDGATYANSTTGVTVNLATGTGLGGDAQGDTLSGIELLQGSIYADTLTGSVSDEALYGGDGNDVIKGGAGNDYLLGGAGDDNLDAEAGDDYLDGGAGNDILTGGIDNDVYFIGRNQGNDRIRNFDSTGANFDQIGLDGTILYTDVWFDRVDDAGVVSTTGAHLKMTVLGATGTEGSVIVENWYTSPDHGLPDSYFKIDLISDGAARAALPVNVDALVTVMAAIPLASRPSTQAQMAALRSGNQNFSNALEEYWGRLSSPKISDTVAISGVEALDNGTATVSFVVRAWFQDDQGLGITIPASQIDLTLTAVGGNVLSSYVSAINYGTPDVNGYRTVTLSLQPNASTYLLAGGTLPLQLQAQIRGTTRTTLDPNGITLTIAPTADTPSFSQLSSAGGNAGTDIALNIAAGSVDVDGSERVDVLIKNLPAGYSLVNGSGAPTGTWDAANSWWRFTAAQLIGLKLRVPVGRYENAGLQIAGQSIDGTSTLMSAWQALNVVVNGTPTNVTLTGSVAENSASGTFVGTLSGIDPDTGEGAPTPSIFQLINDAGGRYILDAANTTRLLVNNGGANLDYEPANRDSINTITVRVTDSTGLSKDVSVIVPVTNVNEAPNDPGGGAKVWSFFDETGLGANPATAGGTVATFALSDPDGTAPTLRFATNGNPNNWFAIVGNQVRFNTGVSFDYEALKATGYGTYDWNADGRIDAYFADVRVEAWDGVLASLGSTLLQVFISDVNERPNPLAQQTSKLYSETVSGDAAHSGNVLATFGMSDPDGTPPALVITGGNANGWFQIANGNQVVFSPGVNFTADWIRGNKGLWGTDADFYYDVDGDGLKEIRVATLTLKAQDASGAQSDPFTYNVYIEDKNEAPAWGANPFTLSLNENPGNYQYVGQVWGSDIDGPNNELRYVFSNWNHYYDNNLVQWVSLSPDSKFVLTDFGDVYVNGNKPMDFDLGQRNFSYQTLIYDKAFGANNMYNYGTLNINLQDVNEPHSLTNVLFYVSESDTAQGPSIPLANTNGMAISLRNSMLSDPEGRNMRWLFANGTSDNGPWHIDSDGTLHMYQGVDFDAIAAVKTTTFFSSGPYSGTWKTYVSSFDATKAIYNVDVQAIDDSTGVVRTSTVGLAVQNIDEAPIVTQAVVGALTANVAGVYQIYNAQSGVVVSAVGRDPEETGLNPAPVTYAISDITYTQLIPYSLNGVVLGTGDIPTSDRPGITINSSGQISLSSTWFPYVPPTQYAPIATNYGSFQYNFTVRVTDVGGHTSINNMVFKFMPVGSVKPPIVFDLDGNGIDLISIFESETVFDMDGDGRAERVGWAGPEDGFLALDRNGNGRIDDRGEISFASDLDGAVSDLEGLRVYDTDGNGFFDKNDERFGEFQIWQDANSDGISQAEELTTLAERGIESINLTLTLDDSAHDESDNYLYGTTEYFKSDGSRHAVGDVFLAYQLTAPPVDESSGTGTLESDGTTAATNAAPTADAPVLTNSDAGSAVPPPLAPALTSPGGAATDPAPSEGSGLAAPIVFDFDRDGKGLVAMADGSTRFDMNGDGVADQTGWIEQGDALLALDRNTNGTIDDISEISFVDDKPGARTDLEGLAGFDSNGDGALSADDARFAEFKLWFDNNSNGRTDAGELLSLSEAGVGSINLQGVATGEAIKVGANVVFNTGVYTLSNGQSGKFMDAGFAYKPLREVAYQQSDWSGKSKDWRVNSLGGALHVVPHDEQGALDPNAGLIGPATLLKFEKSAAGLLQTILVDLDGDGLEARRMGKTDAAFDMDGDGVADDSGWVSGGDGLLVIDRNGDGKITTPAEISFLKEKESAKSAWEALSALDGTKDGKLDKNDARYGDLRVWVDANQDGTTQNGELKTLADLDITEIGLASTAVAGQVKTGYNLAVSTGTFKRSNGVTGTIGDVALGFNPSSLQTGGQAFNVTAFAPQANSIQQAADQLAQAMTTFGIGTLAETSKFSSSNVSTPHDLLTASAA